MSKKEPNKFKDLDIEFLRKVAVEDFAVEVEPDSNYDVVIAALTEAGVGWDLFLEAHPKFKPQPVVTSPNPVNPATLSVGNEQPVDPTQKWADDERGRAENAKEQPAIRVKEEIVVKPTDKFLIKMTRENPLFEVRGYRFTQSHPYALVDAGDANYILQNEDGFRQAFPAELEEFYG